MVSGYTPQAIDPNQSKIPVFATAKLTVEILESFFKEANEACYRHCFEDAPGYLIESEKNLNPTNGTSLPLRDMDITTHFHGWAPPNIIDWAQEHLDQTALSPNYLVILDERSARDDSCILCSKSNMPEVHGEYQILRSDFESALVSLRAKEVGVAGDDSLSTDYAGCDGVFKMNLKSEAEQKAKNNR